MSLDPVNVQAPVDDREVDVWKNALSEIAERDGGSYQPWMVQRLRRAFDEIWHQHKPADCDLAEDCHICVNVSFIVPLLAAHEQLIGTAEATPVEAK
ncbi:hypothetical protein AB0J82_12620 [Asanoa sp. NPDC049518]|uniref:hypothetical protein n=1 Tax=unclassified Asanoa TaxID=2685164 RepID=UPI003441CBF9